MGSNRARAARVDLQVTSAGARRELRAFSKDARRQLGDINASYNPARRSLGSRLGAGARSVGRVAGRGLAAGGRAAMSVAGGLGGLAMGAVGAAGLGLAATAADVLGVEKALTRFQIATDATPQKIGKLREELGRVAKETGISRDQLMSGASAYVALTGDAEGAANSVALFAKVANATGASMEDISATAAAMKDNLGINPKDFEAAFSALSVQGKAGAVELRELSSLLAGVAPSFAAFKGGSGAAGLAEMGAALQVIRKGFGSSAEAATGMRSMMVAIQRNAAKFQAVGVKIYDKDPKTGKKRLRDFSDIVDSIATSRLAKDPTLLTKAFGSDEAKRAYDQLVNNRALLDDLIAKSSDSDAINRDAATYQQSAAGRVAKAWETAKMALADAFTPERIEALVQMLSKLAEGLGVVVDKIDRLVTGWKNWKDGQAAADEDYNRKRDMRVLSVMRRRGVSREEASQQVANEDAAMKRLRSGAEDYKGSDLLKLDREHIAGGEFTNKDDLLRQIDIRLAGLEQVAAGRSLAGQVTGSSAGPVFMAVLKVGENVVARANAFASDQRTRPGGM